MTELYPVFLRLEGRPCLVVGGGAVAERKVAGLLPAAPRITVVAPEATEGLRALAARGELAWRAKTFEPADLEGAELAFAVTSDPETNARLVAEARARGVWVNAADSPQRCDFHVPAVLRRGRAAVAVSSGGTCPSLAAWVRDRLERALPPALEQLAELAEVLRNRSGSGRLRQLFDSGILEDLEGARQEDAGRKVAHLFGEIPEVQRLLRRRSTEAP